MRPTFRPSDLEKRRDADVLDEIENRWHSAECYMGQAFEATTPGQFGYFNQKAWLEFRVIKLLFRSLSAKTPP